jgi:hypothetical protein
VKLNQFTLTLTNPHENTIFASVNEAIQIDFQLSTQLDCFADARKDGLRPIN